MARARNIKPAFFKNEELAELPVETRLLFIGLWTLADREGRMEDRPKRIKAEVFAFDTFDVDAMLTELQARSFLLRYEVNGGRYIQVTNFVKHQDPHYRERASEVPPPPGVSNSIKATNVTRAQRKRIYERDGFKCKKCGREDQLSIDHVTAVANGGDSSDSNLQVLCYSCNFGKRAKDGEPSINIGSTSSDGPGGQPPLIPDSLIPDSLIPERTPLPPSAKKPEKRGKRKAKAPETPLPADFEVFSEMADWALAKGLTDAQIDAETERFIEKSKAKGWTHVDWEAAWRTWILNAIKFGLDVKPPLVQNAPANLELSLPSLEVRK